MGAGRGGNFGNTRGQNNNYRDKISNLPKNPNRLPKGTWIETTPKSMKENTSSRVFTDKETGLTVRFDKGQEGKSGYRGQDHYHVHNPNSTGKSDYYLDKFGNPVPKNSKSSHIIP